MSWTGRWMLDGPKGGVNEKDHRKTCADTSSGKYNPEMKICYQFHHWHHPRNREEAINIWGWCLSHPYPDLPISGDHHSLLVPHNLPPCGPHCCKTFNYQKHNPIKHLFTLKPNPLPLLPNIHSLLCYRYGIPPLILPPLHPGLHWHCLYNLQQPPLNHSLSHDPTTWLQGQGYLLHCWCCFGKSGLPVGNFWRCFFGFHWPFH